MKVSKYLVLGAVVLSAVVVGYIAAPKGHSAAAVADARRAGGDSATAAVSTKYLNDLVKPLKDSIEYYKAKPQAGAKIKLVRDTVYLGDTATFTDTSSIAPTALIEFASAWQSGVHIAESLFVTPPPIYGTRFFRRLHLRFDPDTLFVALLNMPDGTQRFAAVASSRGWVRAETVDAAVRASRHSFIDRAATLAGTGACAGTAFLLASKERPLWLLGSTGVLCIGHVVKELSRK